MHGSVLIVGAGVAGMRAALDLARNGVQVVLVEREPVIGGTMAARLSEASETFGFARGAEIPKTQDVTREPNIEIMTLSEVTALEGEAGTFRATIRRGPRIVTDACTHCNKCHSVCPVVVPNPFHSGLAYRKAIFTPFRGAMPETYVIDLEHCLNKPPNYMPCQRCVEVCEDFAIYFDQAVESTVVREVNAVIVTTGFTLAESDSLQKLGYGSHPDVLTYMELERLITTTGPTGGFLEKPSNGSTPESVLFVMDDASKFSVACVAQQCGKLAEQDVTSISILHPRTVHGDIPFADFWRRVSSTNATLVEGTIEKVAPHEDEALRVRYRPADAHMAVTRDFDLVVFTTAAGPSAGQVELAGALGVGLTEDGFPALTREDNMLNATSRQGVYVAGCVAGLKDIPASIAESKAAVVYAMRHLERRKGESMAGAGNGERKTGVMVKGKWLGQDELQQRLAGLLLGLMSPGGR